MSGRGVLRRRVRSERGMIARDGGLSSVGEGRKEEGSE